VPAVKFRPESDEFLPSSDRDDMILYFSVIYCPAAWNCFEEGNVWNHRWGFKVLMMMPPSGKLPYLGERSNLRVARGIINLPPTNFTTKELSSAL